MALSSENDPARSTLRIPPPPANVAPGDVLGTRYRIASFLGRGGMGEVWLAHDLKLQIDVALKAIRADRFPGAQGLELLRREVLAAREVRSPNVCRIFDLVEQDGHDFVSMEYIDGRTLLEVLEQQGPLELQEATRIASQFLAGLEAIHGAGLVHRDVKPENIMLTRAGRVVVMDLGVAVGVAPGDQGSIAGTPAYMAPEQRGGAFLDPRADIFAAGIVLTEMIAPEGVKDRDSRELVWGLARQEPPRLFDGPWRGVLERAVAGDRERRYPSARELARALEEVTLRAAGAEHKKPYPGLASFTAADAEFFFGREMEVEAVWKKLQRANLLAVIGPSGAGKSSFVQAGLLPARPTGWGHGIFRPGNSPFGALGRALAAELAGDPGAEGALVANGDPETVLAAAARWRRQHGEALLVVDQFEELFTLCPPDVQAGFADLLGRMTAEADLHVLLVMRDDFLIRCQEHPGLASIASDLTMLLPPTGGSLRRALVQPALLCGYRFEDEFLADEMLAGIEGERGALPLLAFAAARLWELRDRDTGRLTREAYTRLGGVSGALAQHAETTLERIGNEQLPVVREIFRNLVTAQGTRSSADVEELLSVFPDPGSARTILKELVDSRLLISFEVPGRRSGDQARHRVEIVHESLLTSWPRLLRWRTQDADSAQLRDQLRQAAQLWKERDQSDDLLWTGAAYREFELWRERYPGRLTATEEAFGRAMEVRANRERRRRRMAYGALVGMLLAVIVVIGWYGRAQQKAHLESEAGKLVALGRAELDANPTVALAHAIAALELADNATNRRFALEALARGPIAFARPFHGDVMSAVNLNFSPDGTRLAVGGFGGLQVLSRDESPPAVLEQYHITADRDAQIAPDGDRVIWRDVKDPTLVRVWSLGAGREVRTFAMDGIAIPVARKEHLILLTVIRNQPHPGWLTWEIRTWPYTDSDPVLVGRWSGNRGGSWFFPDPSGNAVAFMKPGDRGVYYGSLEEFARQGGRRVGEQDLVPYFPWIDPSGTRIATADSSGRVHLWSVEGTGERPLRVLQGEAPIHSLTFDPSGTMLAAVCGPRRTLCLWDLEAPWDAAPEKFRFRYQNRNFNRVAFDPTGRWIVESDSEELVFWPVRRPDPMVLNGLPMAFTPDGKTLVGGYIGESVALGGKRYDYRTRMWDVEGGPSRDLRRNSAPMAVDPRGRFAAVATTDSGCVSLVAIEDGSEVPLPNSATSSSRPAAVSPDGTLVAALMSEPEKIGLRIWKGTAGTDPVLSISDPAESTGMTLAFSPEGSLFSASNSGEIHRRDLSSDRRTPIGRGNLPIPGNLAFAQDGRILFANFMEGSGLDARSRYELLRFDLEQGTARPLMSHGDKVTAVAVDPTGSILVTGDADGTLRVGPATGEEPHVLPGTEGARSGYVSSIAVSPGGDWIAASGGYDPERGFVMRLWRTPKGRPLHTLPHDEFLAHLRAQTNLRVVPDKTLLSGYRVEVGPFPGWGDVPIR